MKNSSKETVRALYASIEKMNYLQYLDITSIGEDEVIDLQSISSPPQCLQQLHIKGHLEKLPVWISKFHLVIIEIFWSRLNDDPLEVIQNLPSLLVLRISCQAYNGEQLHFKIGGFLKLKELYLHHLNILHSLMIDEGALSLLENLSIGPCLKLKEVPSGIQRLRNLKMLEFFDSPKNSKKVWILIKDHITSSLSLYQPFISITRFVQVIMAMTPTFFVPSIWRGQEGKQSTRMIARISML